MRVMAMTAASTSAGTSTSISPAFPITTITSALAPIPFMNLTTTLTSAATPAPTRAFAFVLASAASLGVVWLISLFFLVLYFCRLALELHILNMSEHLDCFL